MIQICKNCKKDFDAPIWRIKRGNVTFCSLPCRYEYNRGDQSPKWKDGKINFSCKFCGKPVYKKKNKYNIFCSTSCSIKHHGPILRPVNIHFKKCFCCDKMISGKKSVVEKAKYCSRECMMINQRLKSENNPNFKNGKYVGGGKSYAIRAERIKLAKEIKSHTIKEWTSLIESYGNQCAKCKAVKPLHKDHILPISKGGHNGIENIQPLCERCNLKKFTKHIKYEHQLKLVFLP